MKTGIHSICFSCSESVSAVFERDFGEEQDQCRTTKKGKLLISFFQPWAMNPDIAVWLQICKCVKLCPNLHP